MLPTSDLYSEVELRRDHVQPRRSFPVAFASELFFIE